MMNQITLSLCAVVSTQVTPISVSSTIAPDKIGAAQ